MKNQKLVQIGGVRERYVPGAGATPVLRTSRVGSCRAGRSHPLHPAHQLRSGSGTEPVPAMTEAST